MADPFERSTVTTTVAEEECFVVWGFICDGPCEVRKVKTEVVQGTPYSSAIVRSIVTTFQVVIVLPVGRSRFLRHS